MQCKINSECTDEFVGGLCCSITVIGKKPTSVQGKNNSWIPTGAFKLCVPKTGWYKYPTNPTWPEAMRASCGDKMSDAQ